MRPFTFPFGNADATTELLFELAALFLRKIWQGVPAMIWSLFSTSVDTSFDWWSTDVMWPCIDADDEAAVDVLKKDVPVSSAVFLNPSEKVFLNFTVFMLLEPDVPGLDIWACISWSSS